MLLCPIATRNPGQRVEAEPDGNIAGGSLEKLHKLDLGIFQRGIRHVVNQRNLHTLLRGLVTYIQARRKRSLRPSGRDTSSINQESHDVPPKLVIAVLTANLKLWPCPVPGRGRQEYRRCARCPRSAESSPA